MLTERQERILLSLKLFDYATVAQLQKCHDLKSDRNAYRVIKQLNPYVSHFIDDGRKVFYLNKKGREVVASEKVRKKLTTAKHYLMRNDLYLFLKGPRTWKNEMRIKYNSGSRSLVVVADAVFETSKYHLVEIDNEQKMSKNKTKIEKYRRMIEKNVFKGMPQLIWVTRTRYRQRVLKELCDGLDALVLLDTDII